MSSISSSDLKTIITDRGGAQTLVLSAESLGGQLKEMGLTTSQIRALFGEVRQIQAQWGMDEGDNRQKALRRLILLKPKMAYRARKENSRAVQELVDVLQPALDEVVRFVRTLAEATNVEREILTFSQPLAENDLGWKG